MESEHGGHEEHFPNYLFIWSILLVLTGTSIVASLLVTKFAGHIHVYAFCAVWLSCSSLGTIKAALVVANFMHLRFEAKYLWVLGLMALFFVGFFLAGTFFDLTLTTKR